MKNTGEEKEQERRQKWQRNKEERKDGILQEFVISEERRKETFILMIELSAKLPSAEQIVVNPEHRIRRDLIRQASTAMS